MVDINNLPTVSGLLKRKSDNPFVTPTGFTVEFSDKTEEVFKKADRIVSDTIRIAKLITREMGLNRNEWATRGLPEAVIVSWSNFDRTLITTAAICYLKANGFEVKPPAQTMQSGK